MWLCDPNILLFLHFRHASNHYMVASCRASAAWLTQRKCFCFGQTSFWNHCVIPPLLHLWYTEVPPIHTELNLCLWEQKGFESWHSHNWPLVNRQLFPKSRTTVTETLGFLIYCQHFQMTGDPEPSFAKFPGTLTDLKKQVVQFNLVFSHNNLVLV